MLPSDVLGVIELHRPTGVCSTPIRYHLVDILEVTMTPTWELVAHVVAHARYRCDDKLVLDDRRPCRNPRPTKLSDEEWSLAYTALRHHAPVGPVWARPRWRAA